MRTSIAVQAGSSAKNDEEKVELMKQARQAQGRALAFFLSSYDEVERETNQIIEAARTISRGKIVDDLLNRFNKAKQEKADLEKS